MKYSAFILIAIFFAFGTGCYSGKKASVPKLLNGSWTPIKQEIGGNALPASYFQSQKLIIKDTSYSLTAESVDKGTLTYRNGKMDIYGKEGVNSGKHFTALYKIENGQLTIVYNLAGDGYPTGFETRSKPTLFLSIFKKD